MLKNSGVTNMDSYTKILVRDTTEEDPEYKDILQNLPEGDDISC